MFIFINNLNLKHNLLQSNKQQNTDLVPVAILDAWVADGGQHGQVHLELVDLVLHPLGDPPGSRLVAERLGHLVRRPPHGLQLIRDRLGRQLLERAWECFYFLFALFLNVFFTKNMLVRKIAVK